MKIAVCAAGTKSLKWFRLDMMRAFLDAGCKVVAMGDEPESDWVDYFAERGIRYRSFFVERNGTNPFKDLRTLRDLESGKGTGLLPLPPLRTVRAPFSAYGSSVSNR